MTNILEEINLDDANEEALHMKKPRTEFLYQVLCASVTILFVIILLVIYRVQIDDCVAQNLGDNEPIYAVIVDAGTTGSRILVYTFHRKCSDKTIVLSDELYVETEPGISSYADDPEMAGKSIAKLLENAYAIVSKDRRRRTPIFLRATAGMRLLNSTTSEEILDSIRSIFLDSGFRTGNDSVEIMKGIDEGMCSWYAVNFLKDSLSIEKSEASIDLGGGSTQVTYEIKDETEQPTNILPGPERNISLFSHSYLNMGVMAMRKAIVSFNSSTNSTEKTSPCINSNVKNFKFKYANINYIVHGSADQNYEACRSNILKIIKELMTDAPEPKNLNKHNVNVFNYYYDIAADAGLIDVDKGGDVLVGDFTKASKEKCTSDSVEKPWLCMDLTYLSILLEEIYHLEPIKKISCLRRVKGYAITWALGLAYTKVLPSLDK